LEESCSPTSVYSLNDIQGCSTSKTNFSTARSSISTTLSNLPILTTNPEGSLPTTSHLADENPFQDKMNRAKSKKKERQTKISKEKLVEKIILDIHEDEPLAKLFPKKKNYLVG